MKYKEVIIKPKAFDDGWHVTVYEDGLDRVKKRQKPSPLGFYHCFDTVSDADAKMELIDCMIEAHRESIMNTTKSMQSLIDLKRLI